MENESFGRTIRLGIIALVVVVILGGGAWWATSRKTVALTTPYQAVLLSNGSAYFGQLSGLGSEYPVLTNVFYVKSTQDPNTKAISNTLVKRGREWHAPDRMILNANMIVLVEPVNPSSRVAQLIAQAKNQ
ncbi:MAG TPA: hypothetical protein VHC90_00690 [Bryobacteraceae bacterium]|nr:hypothetical protein [Bryobacteraceae bacterium]